MLISLQEKFSGILMMIDTRPDEPEELISIDVPKGEFLLTINLDCGKPN
jgi:hypothetical protein